MTAFPSGAKNRAWHRAFDWVSYCDILFRSSRSPFFLLAPPRITLLYLSAHRQHDPGTTCITHTY